MEWARYLIPWGSRYATQTKITRNDSKYYVDDVASINTNANHVKLTTDFKGEKIVIYKNKS